MRELEQKMQKTIDALISQMTTYRTGRANPLVLSKVMVEYYGSSVPLQQLATISVVETMVLQLSIYDKSAVKEIEKAILKSDLGLTPLVDGTVIRLRFPELTEDRRKELVKHIRKHVEDAKIALRNIRRDSVDELKHREKNKDISEDESNRKQHEIQHVMDKFTEIIEQLGKEKEAEIMRV